MNIIYKKTASRFLRAADKHISIKILLAWDPDYTKLTAQEKKSFEKSKEDNYTITHELLKKELGI